MTPSLDRFIRRTQRLALRAALMRILATLIFSSAIMWLVHPLLAAFIFVWCSGMTIIAYCEYCTWCVACHTVRLNSKPYGV